MDYRSYEYSIRDSLYCFGVSFAAGGIIAWLFYQSWYAMILAVPVYLIYRKQYRKMRIKQRQEEVLLEFKDGMQAVSAALLAGYSVENAWREAEKELGELHGKEALLSLEFQQMNTAIKMNRPLEQVLAEFAERSGCEDIENFSEVFCFAKRSGGDFAGIIRTTVQRMNGKLEVEREIATVIAGKKLEGKIMNATPMLILLYLNFTSGDFLSLLYGNLPGVFIMSGALLVYAGAMKLSVRIMDIKI